MLLNFVMQPFNIYITLGVLRSIYLVILLTLIHAFITSRVDFCNRLFYGLLELQILKLQRIRNAAVSLALNIGKHSMLHQRFMIFTGCQQAPKFILRY